MAYRRCPQCSSGWFPTQQVRPRTVVSLERVRGRLPQFLVTHARVEAVPQRRIMRVDYVPRRARFHVGKSSRAFPRVGAIARLHAGRIGGILSAGLHRAEVLLEPSFDGGEDGGKSALELRSLP